MEDDFRKTLRNFYGQENSLKAVEREIWTTLNYDTSVGTKL